MADKKLLEGFLSDEDVKPVDLQEDYKVDLGEAKYDKKTGEVEDIFKAIQDERISSIKQSIEEIEELIDQRKKLTDAMFADIEKIKLSISNALPSTPTPGSDVEMELRRKLVEADEAKVQEKLNSWRDIATLKKEMRDLSKELREKESRISMLDTLLGM